MEKNCKTCLFSSTNNEYINSCDEIRPIESRCINFSLWQPIEANTTKNKITKICDNIKDLLHYKNHKYGDSALNPINTFSKLNGEEAIKIRLDDKISRIQNSTELRKNDVVDIIGYLILLCISKGWNTFDEYKD